MANLIRHNVEWPETIFSMLFFTGTLWVVIGIFVDMLLILRVIILWWKVLQTFQIILCLYNNSNTTIPNWRQNTKQMDSHNTKHIYFNKSPSW
jgi:hypothetical protein